MPSSGPAQIVIPDLGLTNILLEISDPESDDKGPGNYTYPTDAVFEPQVFDLKTFSVGYDDTNMVFKFTFYGPVPNPWGSPNNLSLQTLDVYVDKDPGSGSGARLLLPGRNAALKEGDGWEFAIWAEGWTPQFVAPDADGVPKQVTTVDFKIIVDPAAASVTIRVPREVFGDGDPADWGYAAAVLSQDGFPSPGVWRVRDGQEVAAQWRFGGVPAGATNYTRILDLADLGDQFGQLTFAPSTAEIGTLTPDDFSQIGLLNVP
jgi:carbohydrate-binding DOMON domain-containing protein